MAARELEGMPPTARARLRVSPGANASAIVGRHGEGWKVRVAAPATEGRANAALISLVATVAQVRTDAVRVVAGTSSRDKLVAVEGVDFDTLAGMLDAASGK